MVLLPSLTQAQQTKRDSLRPSVALHMLHDSLARAAGSAQQGDVASALLDRTRQNGLDSTETLALAELHFAAFDPDGAFKLFGPFARGGGYSARFALQRLLRMQMAARGQFDGVEDTLRAARRRLGPTPEDPWHFMSPVWTLARHHADRGEHNAAVRVVLDEIRDLPLDGLFFSHTLPGTFLDSFTREGRRDDAIGHLRKVRDAQLAHTRSARDELPPAVAHRDGTFHRLEEALLRDLPAGETERFLRGRLVGTLFSMLARAQAP
jgi:hypothetical protein